MEMPNIFSSYTVRWFGKSVGTPTAVQAEAWPVIASGRDTLVSAPTGTGKTLSAFLVFIDALMAQRRAGTLKQELQLIYVSPLKSLAGDIRENLRRPLDGILQEERTDFPKNTPEGLDIAVRTGDTPQSERRRMLKKPPHILITTPESLYLMLTAASSQAVLRTARWIILDELHALIGTKRGAHLMLSAARLDALCPKPLQRVGLSATIEPLETAAAYLSPEPATIVAPKMRKNMELCVSRPLPPAAAVRKDPVWQDIAAAVYARCQDSRTAIAFVEGRAYAEKLAYYVNQLGGESFARTHHGSLSKEQRFEVENALRAGTLRLLCATSSMELGIDVGEIDQVFQIGCPRTISGTMQRLGRAGHSPNRTSMMYIFPRTPSEAVYSGLTAEVVRQGGVEHSRPPRLCLDVLAQHLVSMATGGGYTVGDVMPLLRRAYPFREVTEEDVRAVLRMLSGDYEHDRDIPVRPRVLYDRIHDRVEGDPYSRMLAVSAAGTIPDRGLYAVRSETGVKLGELDEEFVFEAREGDKFLLGTFAWQIAEIRKNEVIVKPTSVSGARPPFWKGELRGRQLQTGIAFGKIFRRLEEADAAGTLEAELRILGLDEGAARPAAEFIKRQLAATGILPDDRTVLVEHFRDESGLQQMMVHAVFGRPVNEPLAILTAEAARRLTGVNIGYVADDDGFLLFPYEDRDLPERLLCALDPDSAGDVLSAVLPVTALFNMSFRYNASRALMMGVRKAGRQPLWVQRLRGAEMLDALIRQEEHPLIRETKRECLEDYWDLPGVRFILNGLRSGLIGVNEMSLSAASPMSLPLQRQTEAAMMYDYAPTPSGLYAASREALDRAVLPAGQALAPDPDVLANVSGEKKTPENENGLHTALMIEGDALVPEEISAPLEWLEDLERREQAIYIEPGLWIAAEHAESYEKALRGRDADERRGIVRRLLRYRGPRSPGQVAERYLWREEEAKEVLTVLAGRGEAVEYEGLYYHTKVFDRARRETVRMRREQVKTCPPERYAALLAGKAWISAPPKEKLEKALNALCGPSYPAALWESTLLPARVPGYRPELLDTLLAEGKFFWRAEEGGAISFQLSEDVDWEADVSGTALSGSEREIFEALRCQGASFAQRLYRLVHEGSPAEVLLSLVEKGVVHADSFAPVRAWLDREKLEAGPAKRRARARAAMLTTGRWELTRPLVEASPEKRLERLFDRMVVVCRETAAGIGWPDALRLLRQWEYIGRVRRGYFIEGLSGMQYIREKEYAGVLNALEHPDGRTVWLPAVDPAQSWGKYLMHDPERSFTAVPGTAVALRAGIPTAVFERQGKTLRVFDRATLEEALHAFTQDFSLRRIFPSLRRLTVRAYPPDCADALLSAGFTREMQDFVLFRKVY